MSYPTTAQIQELTPVNPNILGFHLATAQSTNEGSAGLVQILWYIMTSPFTDDATRRFFESHRFFGLEPDQVTFFQ
ncbi:hypothetical protein CMV_016555 [Castanea mollissima]|uniref:Uncharacterized protein n=1 Tax=Castanea mollissima TaxID=60419 RepID=A0A8J4R6T6_9ROSI|nr:hypothetical protein CMV_016555 [Castanea mollissima]